MLRSWLVLLFLVTACTARTIDDRSGESRDCEGGRDCAGDGDGDGDPGPSGQGGASGVSGEGGAGVGGGIGGSGALGGGGIGGSGAFGGTGGSGAFGGFGGFGGGPSEDGGTAIEGDDDCLVGPTEVDVTCPDIVGPYTGACAPKRECCRRSSNEEERWMLSPEQPHVLEYRINAAFAINHPLSVSLPILRMSAAERARSCAGEQCRLMRLAVPRSEGSRVQGSGSTQFGVGRYNCDGTYSWYDEVAAPERLAEGLSAPARWAALPSTTWFDPSLSGVAGMQPTWSTNANRAPTCAPYFLPGTQTIDWEECSLGFELLAFDTSLAGADCQGAWQDAAWSTPGRFQNFIPLADNDRDIIDSISQSYCQLLSFSVLAPEDRELDCLATPRCMPGAEGCKYVKLPDSLCPATDDERSLFRCHAGALGNPNNESGYPTDEQLNCTADAPTEPQDPGAGGAVTSGQCCDPLGADTDGLPACNAFRMVYEFAASAAEITDARTSQPAPLCL